MSGTRASPASLPRSLGQPQARTHTQRENAYREGHESRSEIWGEIDITVTVTATVAMAIVVVIGVVAVGVS